MTEVNIALGIFSIVVTLVILAWCFIDHDKNTFNTNYFIALLFVNILFILSDIVTWVYQGESIREIAIQRVGNVLIYVFANMLIWIFTSYLLKYISQKTKVSDTMKATVFIWCGVIAIIYICLFLMNGLFYISSDGKYCEGLFFLAGQLMFVIVMSASIYIVLYYKKILGWRDTFSFISYVIFPVIAIILHYVRPDISWISEASTLSIMTIYISVHSEQERRIKEKEIELTQMNTAIMLSQIQPHFLYNSLSSIQAMCQENPQKAKEALVEFSKFLRGNMNSLSSKTLIPFSQEMEHVKHYLNLEQLRFGEKLKIQYDIQVEDFYLPPLTIQPIVENAVKYGVGESEDGGTVTIKTREKEDKIVITVEDDGIGFDMSNIGYIPMRDEGRQHIGLMNVRKRICQMVDGDVLLHSKKNQGTSVRIIVSKKKSIIKH